MKLSGQRIPVTLYGKWGFPFSNIILRVYMAKRVSLDKFFEKHPDIKSKVDHYLASVSPTDRAKDFASFQKFIEGELTWAEVASIPKALLKEITQVAYLKFKSGDFVVAETLFKGLAIIDHSNWYYRSALGAIYQKQKLFEQAIDEYSVSLMFEEKEPSTFVNRGECYFAIGRKEEAKKDFEQALALDSAGTNRWAKRASAILNKINKDGLSPMRS